MTKKSKKYFNFDEYRKQIKQWAKRAPSIDQILAEFDRGDFSSLDPDFPHPDFWESLDKAKKKYEAERQRRQEEAQKQVKQRSSAKRKRSEKSVFV